MRFGLMLGLCCAAMAVYAADKPDWQAVTLDGRSLDAKALSGKVVLVHFWASWCPPCRAEMPALQAFYAAHRQEGLEVVAISVDEDRAKARAFAKDFTFPAAMIADAKVDDFGRIWVLPLTFLIDRDGTVRKSDWTGRQPIDAASLDEFVLPLLSAPRN